MIKYLEDSLNSLMSKQHAQLDKEKCLESCVELIERQLGKKTVIGGGVKHKCEEGNHAADEEFEGQAIMQERGEGKQIIQCTRRFMNVW
jgi:hypothetical protein